MVAGGEGGISTWTDWTEKLGLGGLGGVGVQKGRAGLENPLTLLPLLFHQHPPLSSWPKLF